MKVTIYSYLVSEEEKGNKYMFYQSDLHISNGKV